jgi:phosphatidylinositol alpha-1,6-mannosyltransferase
MWIGIFPELSEIGGIQQVSRHIGAVLVKNANEQNVPCQLMGLNDAPGRNSFKVGSDEYWLTGFGRNKIALLFRLMCLMPRARIIYFGHVNLAPLGLILRAVRPRIKYWVVTHGVEVWTPLSMIRRTGLRHAQGVISVSADTADRMAKAQGLERDRVSVLSPALDPAFMEAPCNAEVPSLPANGRMLLTVARLISSEPGKGVDSVIAVLPDVLKAVPDLFYVVIGGGDLQPALEAIARESPARDRILFVGKLKLDQLKTYYSRCDVFVMPSRQEGFGIVFVEAMALGKPVIAGAHGGAPEVVCDGETGYLIDSSDYKTLTRRLIQILQDGALCTKMGDAGRERVERNYTFPRFEEKLTRILNAPT